jgi:hypothetical protein
MATKDISRRLFRATQRYVGARMQQGRQLLDSCWNEGDDERADLRRNTTSDLVGCSGTPDCGFKLTYCEPNIVIEAGVMYAGGLRFSLDAPRYLFGQPDLLKGPLIELLQRGEIDLGYVPKLPLLFYLEGLEAPVTPIEDRELFDPALGGVDTTVRVRRFARVLFDPREPNGNLTCAALWKRFKESPPFCPGAHIDADCVLQSPIRLTVGFVDDLEADDECAVCEPGFRRGYKLAEPQAIRVMLTRDGKRFAWGFENAAPLYRVKVVGKNVELLTAPRDDFHAPQPGQTVEILSWGALLANGEKAAEPVGMFTRVQAVEGSRKLVLEDDATFQVSRVPPPLRGLFPEADQHAIQCDTHFYMRVWNRGADVGSPATRPIVADDGTMVHRLGFTGLTVRFDLDEGAEHGCSGDFWVIAGRPEHPSLVVPWSLLEGERPHGPLRVYAPLGVVKLANPPADVDDDFVVLAGVGTVDNETADADEQGFAVAPEVDCHDIGVGALAAANFSCLPLFTASASQQSASASASSIGGVDAARRPIPLVIDDCRPRFRRLTRGTGCCTLTVGPNCQYETVNDAIAALPEEGGRICLVRGTIAGRIVIEGRHDVEIVGAGAGTFVTVNEVSVGTEPVIDIRDSLRVTLRDFTVVAKGIPGVRVWRTEGNPTATATRLRDLTFRAEAFPAEVPPGPRAAISIVNGAEDRVERCRVTMDGETTGLEPAVYVWGSDQVVTRCEIRTTGEVGGRAWGGVQVDGGSERVRVAKNHIEGGLGHGITIGGIANVLDEPLPIGGTILQTQVPAADRVAIGSIMLDVSGDEPQTRLVVPEAVPPAIPVPTGFLRRIEIRDNVIVGVGTSGIAAAGFFVFEPETPPAFPYIVVDRLSVIANTIVGNLRRAPLYFEMSLFNAMCVATGGIALALVNRTQIRDNLIRDNGIERTEPVCGLFVQSGALEVRGNRIENNGLNLILAEAPSPFLGVRAGIAMPQIVEPVDLETNTAIAMPGLRVVSNIIHVPEGKALALSTRASIEVLRNDIIARGDNLPLGFPVLYTVTVEELTCADGGAATVQIRGVEEGFHATDPDFPPEGGTASVGPWGGAVLFEDNQVTLDWPDKEGGPVCSSVIIAARQSTVSFLRNQIITKTRLTPPAVPPQFQSFVEDGDNNTPKLVVCPCIVEGFAVQFVDNRLTEGYFEAALSAIPRSMADGAGCVTAQNTATHCIMAVFSSPVVYVVNDDLVAFDELPGFCADLADNSVTDDPGLTTYEFN